MEELTLLLDNPDVAYEEKIITLDDDEFTNAEVKEVGLTIAVGGQIYNDKNEILLVRHEHDLHKKGWNVPGGTVQSNESLEVAVRREIHEEVGIEITIDKSFKVIEQTNLVAYRILRPSERDRDIVPPTVLG